MRTDMREKQGKTESADKGPALICNRLCVGYGGHRVAGPLQMEIPRGAVVTLVGPNGAGKSTLLKTIAGRLVPVEGEILLGDGQPVTELPPEKRAGKLAVLLTDAIHPPVMTCRDVVELGRFPYTGHLGFLKSGDRDAAERAMRETDSLDYADRPFAAVSDGQRQRVLLARALCQEPEILLLDEPTSYLDIGHKLALLQMLRRKAETAGLTVLMTLHEIDLAQRISDLVVGLDDRGEASFGAPETVFTKEKMKRLYGIGGAAYDPETGSLEFPAVVGEPEVFVIAAGGRGIPVYRMLQRQGIPFAAGILYDNDIDCRMARRLAAEVFWAPAFAPVPESVWRRAAECIRRCPRVIWAGIPESSGKYGELLKRLAAEHGGPVEYCG